jgi:hypothetical protein
VIWLARRSVWISQDGMAALLPPAERARREALVDLVFQGGGDAGAAREALRASGVRFVFAPAGHAPAIALGAPERANAAGAIYRVEGAGAAPRETSTAR